MIRERMREESTQSQENVANKELSQSRPSRTNAQKLGHFTRRLLMLHDKNKENAERGGIVPETTMEEALDEITPDVALKILMHINSQLRNDKFRKRSEVFSSTMQRVMVESSTLGGSKELIAPEPELQRELFEEYLDAIKKTKGKEKKALLAFYAINNLHFFIDGNGRTSRAVYYLIRDGDLSHVNDLISHNDRFAFDLKQYDWFDGDDGSGRRNFLLDNGIKSVKEMRMVATDFLRYEMMSTGELDENIGEKNIYVNSMVSSHGLVGVMMHRKNRQALSRKEQVDLNFAMSDGGMGTTIAGLALASIIEEKGQAKTACRAFSNKHNNYLGLRVNYDEKIDGPAQIQTIKSFYSEWTPDDYRALLKKYRELKKRYNETIMRFFTDDLTFSDGVKVSDWAMDESL